MLLKEVEMLKHRIDASEGDRFKAEGVIDNRLRTQKAWIDDVAKRSSPFTEREIAFLKDLQKKKWKELQDSIKQFQDEMYNELLDHELDASPDRRSRVQGFSSESESAGSPRELADTVEDKAKGDGTERSLRLAVAPIDVSDDPEREESLFKPAAKSGTLHLDDQGALVTKKSLKHGRSLESTPGSRPASVKSNRSKRKDTATFSKKASVADPTLRDRSNVTSDQIRIRMLDSDHETNNETERGKKFGSKRAGRRETTRARADQAEMTRIQGAIKQMEDELANLKSKASELPENFLQRMVTLETR